MPPRFRSRIAPILDRMRANWPLQRILFLVTGFLALCWFLIRVVPKPQRATYPCQRAAFPLASSFVIWLTGLFVLNSSSRLLLRQAASHRYAMIVPALVLTTVGAIWVYQGPVVNALSAANGYPLIERNAPVGEAKGAQPGRVVWIHNPDATDWAGDESGDHWSEPEHTDMAAVEAMFVESIRQLAGESEPALAWESLFVAFNKDKDRGLRGYIPGERILIKTNLTTCAARNNVVNLSTREKSKGSLWDNIDPAPQLTLALLRQLVHVAGVPETDITIGDTTAIWPNMFYTLLTQEFPDVNYLENEGGPGRRRSEFSDERLHWSTAEADGKLLDFVPVAFAEADYLINLAVLKTHGSGGVTLCAKNHYGSMLRCPDGLTRDDGMQNYYHLHHNLPVSNTGMGKYRAQVDLMGHPRIGGNTFLCIIDGLYGGINWSSEPRRWQSAPFNNDWPSSLFVSQDQVAIDSVAYDFLRTEFPDLVAVWGDAPLDYLKEAALADNPPSGTFYDPAGFGEGLRSLGVQENWNNAIDRQYSRNLGTGEGIELVALSMRGRPAERNAWALSRDGDAVCLYFQDMIPGQAYRVESTDDPGSLTWETDETGISAGYGKRLRYRTAALGEGTFFRIVPESGLGN